MKKIQKQKNKKGFTLAEILITMSIIGIVAAISIPSLLVNINDKTYEAQRNAMLARMSQAVGQMDDVNSYASCTSSGSTCTDNSSAVNFITKGLSKVYKISSVCGAGHLDSCDIASSIKLPDGTDFDLSTKTKFSTFAPVMSSALGNLDADSAGFISGNGESMLVYYNPRCSDKHENAATGGTLVLDEICVNILYDLNGGGKAPNQVGKDIGFLTILYPSTPSVVAPVAYSTDSASAPSYSTTAGSDAASACSNLNGDLILPDRESLISMIANQDLIGNLGSTSTGSTGTSGSSTYWSSTVVKPGASGTAWAIAMDGKGSLSTRSDAKSIRCIKK